jgi:6-pyruvoyltetrahydropterin/6-carboxytetrahydropterin synthase
MDYKVKRQFSLFTNNTECAESMPFTCVVGRTYTFDAAHYIPEHPKCGHIHGHTWKVTVEVMGPVEANRMVLDFHQLNEVVGKVLKKLDHSLLNNILEVPTCENLVQYLKRELELPIPNLHRVIVQEGEGGYAYA